MSEPSQFKPFADMLVTHAATIDRILIDKTASRDMRWRRLAETANACTRGVDRELFVEAALARLAGVIIEGSSDGQPAPQS